MTWETIQRDIQRGALQVHQPGQSIMLTKLVDYGDVRECFIALAAGDMDELIGYLPDLEGWAKENGCNLMSTIGRTGWAKVLQDWKKQSYMTKVII